MTEAFASLLILLPENNLKIYQQKMFMSLSCYVLGNPYSRSARSVGVF